MARCRGSFSQDDDTLSYCGWLASCQPLSGPRFGCAGAGKCWQLHWMLGGLMSMHSLAHSPGSFSLVAEVPVALDHSLGRFSLYRTSQKRR